MNVVSNILSGVPPLFSSLANTLSGEIDCSQQTLQSHSVDGSPLIIRPQAVIYPKHAGDIKQAISFAKEYNMPLTVCGNGKAHTGGALGEGIILNMTRHFTHIRQVNMMEHTITVDAGVTIKTLREKLRGWHMEIPILTSADNDTTIGALVATKSASPSTFHHGTIREWTEALTVVVDTGEEHRIADGITPSGRLLGIYQTIFPLLTENGPTLRASKPETRDDATGYCVWNTSIGPRQLIDELVGGEGTLGIITSVTLRLVPLKPHAHTTCISMQDTSLLVSLLEIAKHHKAEHIFLCDETYSNLTNRYHPGLIKETGRSMYTLFVTHFDTDKERLHDTVRTFTRALPDPSLSLFFYEDTSFIERITEGGFLLSLCNAYTGGAHIPSTFGDGIIVPLMHYAKMLNDLDTYLASTGKLYTISGNAGSGHISVVTLFDQKAPSYTHDLDRYMQSLSAIVEKHKGGLSAVSGDGLMRTPFLSYIYNEATREVFRKTKEAWDPKGILGPGKKTGSTTDFLYKHLSHK
ncbi:MAG: FAD-binding oxidoreductase [Candidatus Paceibacterota bacterium]